MSGSLALHAGILYVGREAKTAQVASFDLDGHPLETRFSFRSQRVGRSAASGLALDADHRIWVADEPAGRLRCFTLFGRQVVHLGGEPEDAADEHGRIGRPVDVLAEGEDEDLVLMVASGGRRRHALQLLHPASGRSRSLRPRGDPSGRFAGIDRIAVQGSSIFACERRAGRIQVFREGFFHYELRVAAAPGRRFEPCALAALDDGRLVVATAGEEGALLLVDRGGGLLRVLAAPGREEGEVCEVSDLAVERGTSDARTRLAVLDADGERVQVFNLEGRCYGAFETLVEA